MRRRLIVSDLDGTLLDERGVVSERTRVAVRAVQRAGHMFVIATGRPVRDVRAVAVHLGQTIAVCGNGSICYDYASDQIVGYQPISPDEAGAALARVRGILPHARFGAERRLELILEPHFVLDPALCTEARRVPAIESELDERGFGKLIIQAPGSAHEYWHTVAGVLGPGCGVTVSTASFCEVTRTGVTKAHALESIARRLGLSAADAVAFGDMPNDLPMLAWAGRSVAVANAHPAVQAVADDVTLSNGEDGVACYLERLLELGPGGPSGGAHRHPA